jgi:hypothetical protein
MLRVYPQLGVQDHFLDGIPPLFEATAMLNQPTLGKYTKPSQRVALGKFLLIVKFKVELIHVTSKV